MNSHSKSSNQPAWHLKTEAETLAELATSEHTGLASEEVQQRRQTYGSNIFEAAKRKSPWRILLGQFTDVLILVLLAAALIAVLMGEAQDSIAILAIVFLNGFLGFTQEYRAEKAMEALQQLVAPHARVKPKRTNDSGEIPH